MIKQNIEIWSSEEKMPEPGDEIHIYDFMRKWDLCDIIRNCNYELYYIWNYREVYLDECHFWWYKKVELDETKTK